MSQINPDNKEKIEEKETPKLPNLDEGQETETEAPPADPEMQKWIEETKSLDNAYKRVQGSKAEVDRWRKEAEEAKRAHDEFQQQLAAELKAIFDQDPETAGKLFGVAQKQPAQEGKQPPTQDVNALKEEIARTVQADLEVNNFYERHKDKVGSPEDFEAIKNIALRFVGQKDRSNKPYTIQTALMDAMLLRHPELIGDKAISEYLTASAKRDSAAMPGDIPSGSSEDDVELTSEEMDILRKMNAPKSVIEGVKRRKAQRLKK